MTKKIEWKWEKIDDNTARVKVFGGWLVLHTQTTFITGEFSKKTNVNINNSESMIFIPDRDYEWMPTQPIVDPEINKANLAKDYEVPKV